MTRSLSRYTSLTGSILAGLLCLGTAAQADTIFQESFANGLNGFTAAGPVTTGTFGVRVTGTFGGIDGAVTSPAISTAGFSNIRLSFTRTTVGLDSGEAGIASVSINGGAFQTIDTQRTVNARTTLTLAAAAANSSLRVRFRIDASTGAETYTVANVLLEGDAANNPNPNPNPGPVGCNNLGPGTFNCTISSAGGSRTYILFVPATYSAATPSPLVIDMHGFTSSASAQMGLSGWRELAATQNFVVAWPQGLSNSWNAQGQCCGNSTADDPRFIRDVVTSIKAAGSINNAKVYATGLSNGGSMSHTMACTAADVFAAAGPVSFTLSGGNSPAAIIANCTPSRPIAVLEFHGTADNLVDFNTGVLDAVGAPASLNVWTQIQQCNSTPTTQRLASNTNCELRAGCGGTANQVGLCTVTGGAHVLYPNVAAPGIARFLWDFFQVQPAR